MSNDNNVVDVMRICNVNENECINESNINNNNYDTQDNDNNRNKRTIIRMKPSDNKEKILYNEGYIDYTKRINNTRILMINPHGLRENADFKIEQLIQGINQHNIDIIMLSETNCKWNTSNIAKMKTKFQSIHRNIEINSSDTQEYDITQTSYLPGGTLTGIFGKYSNQIITKEHYKDQLGKWNAMQIQSENKIIIIITIYRIPDTTAAGNKTCLSQ